MGGFLVYHFVLKPIMQRRAVEQALNEGCEAMAQKFDEEKEEIIEDLSAILSKMDDLDKDEAELREQIEELRQDVQSEVK